MYEKNIDTAFNMLVEEFGNLSKEFNTKAKGLIENNDYDNAEKVIEKAKKFKKFVQRVIDIKNEFEYVFLDIEKQPKTNNVIILNPEHPEDLKHTKILHCTFDNREPRNFWNCLVEEAHKVAMKKYNSYDLLKEKTLSNIKDGKFTEDGFYYVPEIDISIQNTDANFSWKNVLNFAKVLNVKVEVEFMWRHKDKAAHPGKKGKLIWLPDNM